MTGPFNVDIASREQVRGFFNAVYAASEAVPADWTGNQGACAPGATGPAFLEAVTRRINYFRAMAGVPAGVRLDPDFNRRAQQAALMMSANNALSHYPSTVWSCYTAEGAEAAVKCNLALGTIGPAAIDGYLHDHGAGNAAVGHRRWLLYPQIERMGSGDVAASGVYDEANALWVVDGTFGSPRPPVRDGFVSWPPPGYVPYQTVYPRWSFAFAGANFSAASVNVSSNGVPLPVRIEPLGLGFGEETLVWVPGNLNANDFSVRWPRPAQDTTYTVSIQNVLIGVRSTNFTYTVTVIDPVIPGTDRVLPVISGPVQPSVNHSNRYGFRPVPHASGYQWRVATPSALTETDGAENGLDNFVVQSSPGYEVRVSTPRHSGQWAFHLAHPTPPADQALIYRRILLPRTNAQLRFSSRLALASTNQTARVQVSLTEGGAWEDVYAQAGTGTSGERSFSTRSVSLGAYAGRSLTLRFVYDYGAGIYFPQTESGVGWYLDNVAFSNVDQLSDEVTAHLEDTTNFIFVPTQTNRVAMQVRARVFSDFFLEWGPALLVTASPLPPPVLTLVGRPVLSGNQLRLDFEVAHYRAGMSFELLRTTGLPPAWSRDQAVTFQVVIPNTRFRAMTTIGSGNRGFYQVRAN